MPKVCVIDQPAGLGDIFWIRPIVQRYLDEGYEVYYPVIDLYYEPLITYLSNEPRLHWVRQSDDFPGKELLGGIDVRSGADSIMVPVRHADVHFPNCSVMASKYYFSGFNISYWGNYLKNCAPVPKERTQQIKDIYGIPEKYVLLNRSFGTWPSYSVADIAPETELPVIEMLIEKDRENGFCIFDWIDIIKGASEIHSVETSLCYLIEVFATRSAPLHMYEKRTPSQAPTYYNNVNLVYRNKNWIFHV